MADEPPDISDETLYRGHAVGFWYTDTWVVKTLCGLRYENVRMLVYGVPRCKECHDEAARVKKLTADLRKNRAATDPKKRKT